ncbi:hypothetical protein GDO78_015854 [Eleutherodactylus coqui]|uniref:Uncharacterized protein n=1 Tax=Eleutherodactylus coqui TaxID=57060 RepID=A0A8J6ED62_ELECQ|nr:hypothetical protein GDO78_015854 [Eleutherodactylus coqui]
MGMEGAAEKLVPEPLNMLLVLVENGALTLNAHISFLHYQVDEICPRLLLGVVFNSPTYGTELVIGYLPDEPLEIISSRYPTEIWRK